MPVIIVATDFSDVAANAVEYAAKMAMQYKANLHIVHSYVVPVAFGGDTAMPIMSLQEAKDIAEERIGQIKDDIQSKYAGIAIQCDVLYGDIVDALEEYAVLHSPSLIVVGNSGTEETFFWLGSNVLSALRGLEYPVLAVPPDSSFKEVEKICFACDFRNVSEAIPKQHLTTLMEMLQAELHVLNVDYNNRSFGVDTPQEFEELHDMLKSFHAQYHYVEDKNIDEAIRNFIEINKMDWLLVVPHRHNFIESIFKKSHTKEMVKMSHVPILAMHKEDGE